MGPAVVLITSGLFSGPDLIGGPVRRNPVESAHGDTSKNPSNDTNTNIDVPKFVSSVLNQFVRMFADQIDLQL